MNYSFEPDSASVECQPESTRFRYTDSGNRVQQVPATPLKNTKRPVAHSASEPAAVIEPIDHAKHGIAERAPREGAAKERPVATDHIPGSHIFFALLGTYYWRIGFVNEPTLLFIFAVAATWSIWNGEPIFYRFVLPFLLHIMTDGESTALLIIFWGFPTIFLMLYHVQKSDRAAYRLVALLVAADLFKRIVYPGPGRLPTPPS